MMLLSKNSTGVHWMPWEQMGVRCTDPQTCGTWTARPPPHGHPPAHVGQEPDIRPWGRGSRIPPCLPAIESAPGRERGEGGTCRGAVSGTSPSPGAKAPQGLCSGTGRGAASSPTGMGRGYLSDVFLLLLLQGHQDEDLLQLLVAVVDDELLKAVVLREKGPAWQVMPKPLALPHVPPAAPGPPQQQDGAGWVLHSPGRSRSRRCPGLPSPSSACLASPGETAGC